MSDGNMLLRCQHLYKRAAADKTLATPSQAVERLQAAGDQATTLACKPYRRGLTGDTTHDHPARRSRDCTLDRHWLHQPCGGKQ
ncbi:hypothetical protein EMIT0P218_50044 [Pseudomonas sp. IT-P218]